MLSLCEDELDIVGEGEIDDNIEEKHVQNSLPSTSMKPIVQLEWANLELVLLNDRKVFVVEGTRYNVHPHDCVDQKPLGNEDVGGVILESLVHSDV